MSISPAVKHRSSLCGPEDVLFIRISLSLFFLSDCSYVFQKDFEDAFGITRSTASKVCSLMETKGLIQRQPVSDDARLKKITLTDRGEAMRREMIEGRKRMEAKLTAGFSSEELQTLRDYLRRMKENMKR